MEPFVIPAVLCIGSTVAYMLLREWKAKPKGEPDVPVPDPAVSTAVSTLVAEQGRIQGY